MMLIGPVVFGSAEKKFQMEASKDGSRIIRARIFIRLAACRRELLSGQSEK